MGRNIMERKRMRRNRMGWERKGWGRMGRYSWWEGIEEWEGIGKIFDGWELIKKSSRMLSLAWINQHKCIAHDRCTHRFQTRIYIMMYLFKMSRCKTINGLKLKCQKLNWNIFHSKQFFFFQNFYYDLIFSFYL